MPVSITKILRNKKDRERYSLKKTNGIEKYNRMLKKKCINRKKYYIRHIKKITLDASLYSSVFNPEYKTRVTIPQRVLRSIEHFPDTIINHIFEYLGPGLSIPKSYQWIQPGIRIYYNKGVETNYRLMIDSNDVLGPYRVNTQVGQWFHCLVLCSPFFNTSAMEWFVQLKYFDSPIPWNKPWIGYCVAAQRDHVGVNGGYALRNDNNVII
jgi:hypothetical protein